MCVCVTHLGLYLVICFILFLKERDSNKSMLESYEREASADKATTSQRNIKQLQDTLRSYQNHVTGVETELEQKTKELTMAISNVKVVSASTILSGQLPLDIYYQTITSGQLPLYHLPPGQLPLFNDIPLP